jgi:hypothetical protein
MEETTLPTLVTESTKQPRRKLSPSSPYGETKEA